MFGSGAGIGTLVATTHPRYKRTLQARNPDLVVCFVEEVSTKVPLVSVLLLVVVEVPLIKISTEDFVLRGQSNHLYTVCNTNTILGKIC